MRQNNSPLAINILNNMTFFFIHMFYQNMVNILDKGHGITSRVFEVLQYDVNVHSETITFQYGNCACVVRPYHSLALVVPIFV